MSDVIDLAEIRRAVPVDSQGRERLWFRTEARAAELPDGRKQLGGTVNTFGVRARISSLVVEEIAPTAFNNTLSRQDIMLLWQHDPAVPFARTGAGNLDLEVVDGARLDWRATMPDTQAARDAIELVTQEIVNRMSFGFTVPDGGDTWEYDDESGMYLRTIHDLRLWEVSLVTWPAYSGTSAAVRADAFVALCRRFGLDEAAVLEKLQNGSDAGSDVRDAFGATLLEAAPVLRAAPGAGTTSGDAERVGTTVPAGALDTHTWALRFASL